MSQKSSTYRVIEILKMLNDGKSLYITDLANRYHVNKRTIYRDIELICEIFGDFITKNRGYYKAYKKVLLEDVLNATDLMTLSNIITLFGEVSIQNSIQKNTKELVKKSLSIYEFKIRPFEVIKNRTIIKTIEHAIKFQKELNIEYKISRGSIKFSFYPYKILFLNENFYLVGENLQKNRFEFLRISLIVNATDTKKNFFLDYDIVEFIKHIQTPWTTYNSSEIIVKLRVSKDIRKYFQLKKYLPSQKIIQTFQNGDIEVQYKIHNLKEIEDIIIKWLPKIQILSPESLKTMIKRSLKKKLKGL